jgi:antitoxin (DNA-binding transcriptional repressor) of toxin-antitoxin stability system
MKTVSIHDAKTNLSKYIVAAKNGEKVYIGGFGKAEVVLTKLPIQEGSSGRGRSFSLAKGKVVEKQGAFSTSTDQSIATFMYGD